ncbi:hypothetical protein H6P81_010253 [Aristolochia fimbriata]|uniref:Uncharacterized protein n=1 Tax=Aristolochia fimbriata TaxID=158543 RepID=A0AAV7ESP9_ARIFI|nr:hypothetical protein H6P81_010253 [Aristolochia fimbriata]
MELAAQGRIEIEGAQNTASSYTISIRSEWNQLTQPNKKKATKKEYRPKPGSSSRPHNKQATTRLRSRQNRHPRGTSCSRRRGWILVTRRKKPIREIELAPATIKTKSKAAKQKSRENAKEKLPGLTPGGASKKKRRPVTLAEFFPKEFLASPAMVATCSTAPPEQAARKDKGKRPVVECDDLEMSLKQISPLNKIEDNLDLEIRSRKALIRILDKPEELEAELEMLLMRKHDLPKVGLTPPYRKEEEDALSPPQLAKAEQALAVTCPPCITFREEDIQLGTKNHNRPLFVSGYIRDQKVNRMLIDCGSAVNILPIRTMKDVGISAGDLSPSSLLIQGFNQEGQRTLGMISVKLHIGDMVAETPFQVIDSRTSYNLLLGRPWLHSNGVVPSTLHQCFKYWENGEQKTVYADESPFTEAEASFADAKYYLTTKPALWSNQAANIEDTPTQATSSKPPMQAETPKQPSQNIASKQTPCKLRPSNRTRLKSWSPKQPACDSPTAYPSYGTSRNHKGRKAKLLWSLVTKVSRPAAPKSHSSSAKTRGTAPRKQFPNQQKLPATRSNEGFDPNAYRPMASRGNLIRRIKFMQNHLSLYSSLTEQEKLRNKGQRIDQGRAGSRYEKTEANQNLHRQTKPIKITRKGSADASTHEVAVHKLAVHFSFDQSSNLGGGSDQNWCRRSKKGGRQIDSGKFHREVKYPTWIANIAPVKKKTGQTELMVDATTGHEALSFMDGSSGYNQIRMDPKDEELTAFRTPKGIFCYKVMPFGLKNAGATYQRAMQNIFDDFLHKRVECYVDDLVVKTKQRSDHLLDLRAVFERLRRFQLKMNPLKCAFGVTSGKFLGFIVHHRGIEIDQSKIDAIQKMPAPRNVSELKSFQGHLAYIRRFISNLAGRCQPFSRLLKKETPFEWDESCQNAFNNIKAYLTKPPVLVAPTVGRPLLLYIAAQEGSVGALLAQCGDDNKERSLYYLSRTLHLRSGAGPSPVRFGPKKDLLPYSFVLTQACSNNEAQYQAILLGLGMAVEMQIPQLHIYGDSALVIKQLTGEFEVKKPELEPFWRQAGELLAQIPEASLHFVPRSENGPADALAGIAASLAQFDQLPSEIPICERWVIPPRPEDGTEEEQTEKIEESFPISASQNEVRDWREPIAELPSPRTLPVDLRERVQIRAKAAPKSALSICLSKEEGLQVLKETHSGICGAHQAGPKLHLQTKRLGYYWPSMLRDAIEMARTCKQCQLHADYIHQAPEPLHPTVASWPFEAWGMDIIGPISPKSDSDRQYILAATDYFSKWAEAAAYREVKAATVVDFIRTQIIYRYGVPRYIMTDNVNGFSEAFNKTLCKILKKTIGANKRSWDEKLGEALWAYRTPFNANTDQLHIRWSMAPAVLPSRYNSRSLRNCNERRADDGGMRQLRLAELESLDERRLEATTTTRVLPISHDQSLQQKRYDSGHSRKATSRACSSKAYALSRAKTGANSRPNGKDPTSRQEAYLNGDTSSSSHRKRVGAADNKR